MDYRKMFSFIEGVYFPAVVCNKKGKIIYKNSFASRIDVLPKAGVSIESVVIQNDLMANSTERIHIRRLRSIKEVFRTALVVPFESTEMSDYVCWIFDISFQFLDKEAESVLLERFSDFRFPVCSQISILNNKEIVNFRRLCDLLCTSTLAIASGRRICNVRNAVPSLLYSIKDTLSKFGLKVSVDYEFSENYDRYIDFAKMIYSAVYSLIFSVPLSKAGYLTIHMKENNEQIITDISFLVNGITDTDGSVDRLIPLFPEKNLLLEFAGMLFEMWNIEFHFKAEHGYMKITLFQKTQIRNRNTLHQNACLISNVDFAEKILSLLEMTVAESPTAICIKAV